MASDATNFFWDNTNKRLGLATNSPTARMSLKTTTNYENLLDVKNTAGATTFKIVDDGFLNTNLILSKNSGEAMFTAYGQPGSGPNILLNGVFANEADGSYSPFGAATYIVVPTVVNQENGIFFGDSPSGASAGAGITHYVSDTSAYGRGGLHFKTTAAANPTTRMTIDPNGLVGIGTTSPGAMLSVKAAAAGNVLLDAQNTSGSTIFKAMDDGGGNGSMFLYNSAGTAIFQANAYYNVGPAAAMNGSIVNMPDGSYSSYGAAQIIQVGGSLNNENGLFFSNAASFSAAGAAITHTVQDVGGYGRGSLNFKTANNGQPATRMSIDMNGKVGVGTTSPTSTLTVNGSMARNIVTTTTATYTVAATDTHIITNRAAGIAITLPAAASFPGREITIRNIAAGAITSASSNVVPLAGGAAGTAIVAATAGKWVMLVSDGTNWQIQMGN